ncbi:TlpA family protein disulfide reductase [Rhabdothermincola salaria]|uniref:TlpA family protein disulfide reductase n=1 Tax=Rhabdothermincola salaria TaxID=2903142 RepID=UPI001E364990|nr:TlpA family protein disulfide reductase [Rhabdothermincola salaria]
MSRGLLTAVALATVVLAIATFVAFRSDGDDTAVPTERLTPGATLPQSDFAPDELTSQAASEAEGEKLPDASYTLFEGGTAQLSTDGRPLVINVWASWCIPCVAEMPAFDEVYRANVDQVGMLGLQALESSAEDGLRMIEQTGITYPVGRDLSGELVRELGTVNLPTTVLVTADGTIVDVHTGPLTATELQDLIDEHLRA